MTKDKFKTFGNVFDNHGERTLLGLMSQRIIDGLESPICIGKEANVFSARKKDKKLIVKIYRLETCDFNKMYSYIRTDPRFQRIRRKKRSVIFEWTKREFKNLMKARDAGIRVPTPITQKDNIIVMEFIGDKDPAPKIKDSDVKIEKFAKKTMLYMKKLHKAKLVHGDLSEFNILEYKSMPVFIDFSQTTSLEDVNAKEWLERDCYNMAKFFSRRGFEISKDELLKYVKGDKNGKLR